MTRRSFVRRSSAVGGGLAGFGALQAYGAKVAAGQTPGASAGYGPLVPKTAQNDPAQQLFLPAAFNFAVISRQGVPMSDGNPTPGIFDGTGAYRGRNDDETILIRNHENRRSPGEIPVVVPADMRYDPQPDVSGGNTKLVVRRHREGRNPDGSRRYAYEVTRDFAILGGTDTNCAGGVIGDAWYTCEEVVNRSAATGVKHGYNFVVPAYADGPVEAVPLPEQGRFVHEAVAEVDGILYQTEDRRISADPLTQKRQLGSCLYRIALDSGRHGGGPGAKLQALKLVDEFHADMNGGPNPGLGGRIVVGRPYRVEWVDIDEPDHDDDTGNLRTRQPGLTPTAVQGQDKGAAFFNRLEGIWTDSHPVGGRGRGKGRLYFDATEGGAAGAGQVFEPDTRRQTITLIFESPSQAVLDQPDNLVIVPRTGDVFLQEDGSGEQYVRGVTREGEIFDFARTATNDTEFCGGCFDADGFTFFVSQQGDRLGANEPPQGTPESRAVTYAIYGPFEDRAGLRGRDHDDD
jgi:uncharacterized protein